MSAQDKTKNLKVKNIFKTILLWTFILVENSTALPN